MKRTKSVKGIQFGDVANIAVRNVLSKLSVELFGQITDEQLEKTEEFFDYHCPYTGKDLREAIKNNSKEVHLDHIVPTNKDYCGLNVYGNVVYVDASANSAKSSKNYDDFIRNNKKVVDCDDIERERRIEKIKEFQKESGYDAKKIREELYPKIQEIYSVVQENQEKFINESSEIIKEFLPVKTKTDVLLSEDESKIKTSKSSSGVGQFIKNALIEMIEKKELSDTILEKLQDKKYCSDKLKISYSVLVDISKAFDSKRYYTDVISGKYRICSQWVKKHKERFESWKLSL